MNTSIANDLFRSISPVNGVYLIDPPSAFEEHYAKARSIEDRILTDEQVRSLPKTKVLWNDSEWRIRTKSAERLSNELKLQGPTLRILEVGCGNGWLSSYLQKHGHTVLGIDPFTLELEQAARVFEGGPTFARMNLFNTTLRPNYFDAVVFAASIQYFRDPVSTLKRALDLLCKNGRVHVMDTVLYANSVQAAEAKERSRWYYKSMGVPEMGTNYFAHTFKDLEAIGPPTVLHRPSKLDRIKNRVLGEKASPFTHLVLRGAT